VTTHDANRQLAHQLWDIFNRGDMAAASEFFAEDTKNHGRPVGRAGVGMVFDDIKATFPDVHFKVLDVISEGDWIATRGMASGTHRGVAKLPHNGGLLVGVPPTGRHFEVQHIHMVKLRNGKIVEHFANRDDIAMMQQLGLLPS
jgi:predicted ester cyclase